MPTILENSDLLILTEKHLQTIKKIAQTGFLIYFPWI
jgi:hypothetical protein